MKNFTAIRAEGLGKSYYGRAVFSGLSFEVPGGQTLALVGASGCGKSTLLHIAAGLIPADQGRLERRPENGRVSLLMQHYGLFPWKTAWSNLSLPLEIMGLKKKDRLGRVERILDELGLAGLKDRYPAQMSGGQRQRLALGRALAAEPDLLLLDEPFSALDAITRENLQKFLADLWREKGLTIILATHSLEEAVFLGRRILVLGGQPTSIVADLANPGSGRPGYRSDEKYFQLLKSARKSLEAAGGYQEEAR